MTAQTPTASTESATCREVREALEYGCQLVTNSLPGADTFAETVALGKAGKLDRLYSLGANIGWTKENVRTRIWASVRTEVYSTPPNSLLN